MFSSILRAQVSLAWVIGPPLAYALAMGFSFYGDVPQRGGGVCCLRRNGLAVLTLDE